MNRRRSVERAPFREQGGVEAIPPQHKGIIARRVDAVHGVAHLPKADGGFHAAQVFRALKQRKHVTETRDIAALLEAADGTLFGVGDLHGGTHVDQRVAKLGWIVHAQEARAGGGMKLELPEAMARQMSEGRRHQAIEPAARRRARRLVRRAHARGEGVDHLGTAEHIFIHNFRRQTEHLDAGAVGRRQHCRVAVEVLTLLVAPVGVQQPDRHRPGQDEAAKQDQALPGGMSHHQNLPCANAGNALPPPLFSAWRGNVAVDWRREIHGAFLRYRVREYYPRTGGS